MQLLTHALGRLENADSVYTYSNAYSCSQRQRRNSSWLVSIVIRLFVSRGSTDQVIINAPYLVCWFFICLFACLFVCLLVCLFVCLFVYAALYIWKRWG